MSEERRARRASSKTGHPATGPGERERLPVRVPASARTEPVRPRSTTQRPSAQTVQRQSSHPNTIRPLNSLTANPANRSTPVSPHSVHNGRGGDVPPILLAHRANSKKLHKSPKHVDDDHRLRRASHEDQRPPSVQRVGLGFDLPASSEQLVSHPSTSSSQSRARSPALTTPGFSDDSDNDDRPATEPESRAVPLRPMSHSHLPRASSDNRPSNSHQRDIRDHHAVPSSRNASGASESRTRGEQTNRRVVSDDLRAVPDRDDDLRLLAAVPPRRAPVPAVLKNSEPDRYTPEPSKFVKLESSIGRDGAGDEGLDDQHDVASPSRTGSLRTTRRSDKFGSHRRSMSPVIPSRGANHEGSPAPGHSQPAPPGLTPPVSTPAPNTPSVTTARNSGPRGLKSLKIPSLSSRFSIGKGSSSPIPSAEASPAADSFGSRIPGPHGSRSSSLPSASPALPRMSASPQVRPSALPPARPQQHQPTQLALRKTSAASATTTSGASTTSDSRTFVDESDSAGVPSLVDQYSNGKPSHVHLFATNPDPAPSSSVDSVVLSFHPLAQDRHRPSTSPSPSLSSSALPAPGVSTRSRQPSDARRMNALMDGLGLVPGAASEPQHGSQQGTHNGVDAPLVSRSSAEEPEMSSERSRTFKRAEKIDTPRHSSEYVGQIPRWTAPSPSDQRRRSTTLQYHDPSAKPASSDQDVSLAARPPSRASEGVDSRSQSRISNHDHWGEYDDEPLAVHSPYTREQNRPSPRAKDANERESYSPWGGSRSGRHSSTPRVRELAHLQPRACSMSPQGSEGSDYRDDYPMEARQEIMHNDDAGAWMPIDERYNSKYLPSSEIHEEELPPRSEEQHYIEGDEYDPHIMVTDHFRDYQEQQDQDMLPTPTSDTDLSSFGSFSQSDWRPVNEVDISTAAEALFHGLKGPKVLISSSSHDALPPHVSSKAEVGKSLDSGSLLTRSQRRTWRSTVTPAAYEALRIRYGEFELQRQELIWDICESERTFLRDIRVVLQACIQPLRTHDRHWLPGVPSEVARVFDWLDDIVQLHAQIHSALHAARSKQYPVIVHVAETLRPFVARLEIHQPYLARFDQATNTIKRLLDDPESDFGEFVRMQLQEVPELGETSLIDVLKLPNILVMGYPNMFQALYRLTPRDHPDHLAAFSLFHSTAIVVRAMLEVHAREEEYDCVKDLAKRIIGLPLNFNLASRERRLVAQGMLRRVYLTESERLVLEQSDELPADDDSASLCMPIVSPQYLTTSSPLRPVDTFNWNKAADSFDAVSNHSETGTALSADAVVEAEERDTSGKWRSSRASPPRPKRDIIYVFVFSDIVLFTSRSGSDADSWKLLDDVGMARVTAVVDQSGKLGYDHLVAVDVLPMAQERGGINVAPMDSIPCPVFFTLCDHISSRKIPPKVLEDAKLRWIEALHKCFLFTLRSLSFPCHGDDDLAHGPTADLEMDTKTSVMSILSVGLPMPKSPSQLIGEHERGRPADPTEEEREERGWWAVRFRQVLREIQRQEIPPFLLEQPVTSPKNTIAPPQHPRIHSLPLTHAATRTRSSSSAETHSRRRSILSSRPLLLPTNISTIMLTPSPPARG